MTSTRLRFRPHQRLHTPDEYESVFAKKCSAGDGVLLVFVDRSGAETSQLGTSVGKRCGNSVVRHQWKRYIREAFRLHQGEWASGIRIVVVPRPGVSPNFAQVEESLRKLISRAVRKLNAANS